MKQIIVSVTIVYLSQNFYDDQFNHYLYLC